MSWPTVRGLLFGLALPVLIWAPIVATFQPAPHTVPGTCPTEDSSACAWHGGTNGIGRTFTVTSDGLLVYPDGTAQRTDLDDRPR